MDSDEQAISRAAMIQMRTAVKSHGSISEGVLFVFVACRKHSCILGKRRQLSHQSLELATTPGGGNQKSLVVLPSGSEPSSIRSGQSRALMSQKRHFVFARYTGGWLVRGNPADQGAEVLFELRVETAHGYSYRPRRIDHFS